MVSFNIGSLNINGCRDVRKRSTLFKYLQLKKADVILLQETHTDACNETDWINEWEGSIGLSHGTNLSAGVAFLFSKRVKDNPVILEIIPGRLLRADIVIGNNSFSFYNIYAPNIGSERCDFLKELSEEMLKCSDDKIVVIGGDFNCTVDHNLDRNHEEPHFGSVDALKSLINRHNLIDLWRHAYPHVKQYTWLKMNSNHVSAARLDRFYTEECNKGRFFSNRISPTSMSDHHYISMSMSVLSPKSYKSHWHFNNTLLQDHIFVHSFGLFWKSWREERGSYSSLRQWWDLGKVQIKTFCQQYTANNTENLKVKMKMIEQEILQQSLHNQGGGDIIKENKGFLKDLLEEQEKETLVRTRYVKCNEMDAPTAFFFGLEKKSKEQKFFHRLKLPNGNEITNQREIIVSAISFYEKLYQSELCDEAAVEEVLLDLPQLSEEEKMELEGFVTFSELSSAVQGLNSGKSSGVDGLSAEFFKSFWNVIGYDLYDVFLESFNQGVLPLSCRRAVLTLIPKKGDLGLLKNWRPVSLLCTDFKILSKAITNRLKKCMGTIIHEDQSYCIPKRTIFDNLFLLRDIIAVAKNHQIDIGLLSLDQEKAFDRVDHFYLLKTLKAFGFGPQFVSCIKLLYSETFSMLKINGCLTRPFAVTRGIRQGCPLSGLLYSIAIEPLLSYLRKRLHGFCIPGFPEIPPVKLTAYADDITVFIRNIDDMAALTSSLKTFQKATSARINWDKCTSLLLGEWRNMDPPQIPQQCEWIKDGFKVLGVYLGSDTYMKKNWEGLVDKIVGKLQKWRWILPQLSFRGRCLIINNLAASMLWHRFTVLNPPEELLIVIQKAFINFFWDGYHWLPPGVLYLPVIEGGQGLINLEARVKTMRFQTLQRLLYCSDNIPWIALGLSVLQSIGGIGLAKQLFLIEKSFVSKVSFSSSNFYVSVLKAWQVLTKFRDDNEHCGVLEPLFFNSLFKTNSSILSSVINRFLNTGISTVKDLIDFSKGQWFAAKIIANKVGLRSERYVEGIIGDLKKSFPQSFLTYVNNVIENGERSLIFPDLKVNIILDLDEDLNNTLLKGFEDVLFHNADKKILYCMCVKSLFSTQLKRRVDTKWREYLSISSEITPAWRCLYKPPIPKRSGDLQWRVLHCAVATNNFVSKFNGMVLSTCPFCNIDIDTVFHFFCDCLRLIPLFELLDKIFTKLGFMFTKNMFILGVKYKKEWKAQCTLGNFLVGQAKLAILKSHGCKNEGRDADLLGMFRSLVEGRVFVEYAYCKSSNNMHFFDARWSVKNALVMRDELGELLFNW